MTEAFIKLSNTDLQSLISGLRSRRIAAPYTELQLSRILARGLTQTVAADLSEFESLGFTSDQIEAVLELLINDRSAGRKTESQIDLVTSGPEAPGVTNRDTAVVVRELFSHATTSVLVVGYAVYQGQKVFESLADRMNEIPDLDVDMFLDIARSRGDTTKSEILVSRFVERFKSNQWPAERRLPKIYYDPRSISDEANTRSALHAKCIVVDRKLVFVSSANFTEAAQLRNIEVGLKIESTWLAERLVRHFQKIQQSEITVRVL